SSLIDILNINSQLITCPIIREQNGLAMSSRNLRLSEDARRKASFIYQTLSNIKEKSLKLPFNELLLKSKIFLEEKGFKVEYLVIADRSNLQIVDKPVSSPMICLIAAWLKGVRLIDNVFL
ncbi:MAG: pantoate--beta-alanine ligase, partial [Chitinophagaceae bacterium]